MELEKKINELKKVISALIQLALEIGTLIAIIKMIIQSINIGNGSESSPP